MEQEKMHNIAEINLKNLFKTLLKRKTVFFITFFSTLAICLIFTFLFTPMYSSTFKISISDIEIFYNKELYKYFPSDADSLWIIPDTKEGIHRIDYIVGKLDAIDSELKSDFVLNSVISGLNGKITRKQLLTSISVSVDRWVGIVTIKNYASTPELAYYINKSFLESYTNKKKSELENFYNIFLSKLSSEIELVQKESEQYEILNTTIQNMIENKNYFIDRIKIIEAPELINVQNTSNYLRNILFSFIVSFTLGIIVTFVFNYFKKNE